MVTQLTLLGQAYHKLVAHQVTGQAKLDFCRACLNEMFTWEQSCLEKLYNNDFFWDWVNCKFKLRVNEWVFVYLKINWQFGNVCVCLCQCIWCGESVLSELIARRRFKPIGWLVHFSRSTRSNLRFYEFFLVIPVFLSYRSGRRRWCWLLLLLLLGRRGPFWSRLMMRVDGRGEMWNVRLDSSESENDTQRV